MTIETFESEFAEALTTIASGLGIAAERIFGTFVSAQVLIGIIDVASVFLTLFGALFLGWYARKLCMKWWKDDDGEWGNDDKEAAGIWVPCTVAVIVAAVGFHVLLRSLWQP
jgi:arginine exporter protein ArgO